MPFLDDGHALAAFMVSAISAMDYGINQGKQSLFIVPLNVNRAFALHYTKYTVYKYTSTNQNIYWMSRRVSSNHQLASPHGNYT